MNPGAGTVEARGSRVGYLVVVLGAALFVAGCFVPYHNLGGPAQRTFSLYELYEQTTMDGFDGGTLGGLLYLFAGVAIVASIAVVGIARSGDPQPRVRSMLIGAVAAWSLQWTGIMLIGAKRGLGGFEIGYWVQAVSIGVVIVGTIVVMASARAKAHKRDAT